jgi:tetratricopeptide (TPR) repeat protein
MAKSKKPAAGPSRAELEALDRAQDLAYSAMDARTSKTRVKRAMKALEVSPLCADAHVILAQEAANPEEALAHYERGVAAGRAALGERAFKAMTGHFWGYLETRPYMRAAAGMAATLSALGREDEAMTILTELLRLNPNDNQGNRYPLLDGLLALGRDDAVEKLLEDYNGEKSAWFDWSRVLLAFKRHGDGEEARAALTKALTVNQHVAEFLTGRSPIPAEPPTFYSPGQDSEALAYLEGALRVWTGTAGAIAWVRETVPPAARKRATAKTPARGMWIRK